MSGDIRAAIQHQIAAKDLVDPMLRLKHVDCAKTAERCDGVQPDVGPRIHSYAIRSRRPLDRGAYVRLPFLSVGDQLAYQVVLSDDEARSERGGHKNQIAGP